MRPVYHSESDMLKIIIKTEKVLPCEVYTAALEAFEKLNDGQTKLVIDPDKCDCDTNEMIKYFNLLSRLYRKTELNNLIPVIQENRICLKTDDTQLLEEVGQQIRDFGIRYEVTNDDFKVKSTAEPVFIPTRSNSNESGFNGFPKRRSYKQNFNINKESYRKVLISTLKEGMDKICFSGLVFKVEYQSLKNKSEIGRAHV